MWQTRQFNKVRYEDVYFMVFDLFLQKPTQKREKYSDRREILQKWLFVLVNETEYCETPHNQLNHVFKIPDHRPT